MRRLLPRLCLAAGFVLSSHGQTIKVGDGAPSSLIAGQFVDAFNRNGFNKQVALPPLAAVTSFGATGWIQQFSAAGGKTGTFALIKPDSTDVSPVSQVQAAMFAYYSTVTVLSAGYPTGDTQLCPALRVQSNPQNSCQWQQFSNNYALFVYTYPLMGGTQNFTTNNPFFAKWMAVGGINAVGPANSAAAQTTSSFNSQAKFQTFDAGAVYDITAGLYSGRVLAVSEPIYDFYVSNGAHTGSLGFPTTDDLVLSNGMHQQSFEGGAVQYDPATGIPVLRPPVYSVKVTPAGPITMNFGDTATITATVSTTASASATDRTVVWSTSNGNVVQIQPSGLTATIKAIAGGVANVTATAEGKASPPLTVSVASLCCQIGEGAPTASIQQAMQTAVVRNSLSVSLPAAAAVRLGSGYVQQLVSTASPPVSYLIAVPDGSGQGYVVSGTMLAQYTALGGPTGSLGYPLSDATSGGRQMFQQGALAGSPPQLVAGAILNKWGTLGYETGAAGLPAAAATAFLTYRGTSGNVQNFQNGAIVAPANGALAGQAFFVSGPVLATYNSAAGPGGNLGAPTDDEHAVNGLRQQDFEGGFINYAIGSSTANMVTNPRQPLVSATPNSVVSGTPVHLTAGGFSNGATLRISQTGQADFLVTVPSGVYAWDVWVPANTASGSVTVSAADVNSKAVAQASYTVVGASASALTLSMVSGDLQNGAPGAQLAQPLVVVVKDQNGNPVAGQVVTFTASPGGQITPASLTTGSNGQASAALRLPLSAGVALATAEAAHHVVTFGALSVAGSLPSFPSLTQAVDEALGGGTDTIRQKGAFLTAVASVLRYFQLLHELPQPNGLADPSTLNQFLKTFCTSDSQGNPICDGFLTFGQSTEQIVNLWRVGAFVANDLDVRIEDAGMTSVRDLVSRGSPVLLALSLGPLGSHFVVATGIAPDGGLLIADPNPTFAQTSLNGYLQGFSVGGVWVQGTVSSAVRLVPQTAASAAFLAAANAPVSVSTSSGTCARSLQFPDTAAVPGNTPAGAPGTLYFQTCDGLANSYELDVAASASFSGTFTDLSAHGSRVTLSGSAAEIVRSGTQWSLSPLAPAINPAGIGNPASFTSGLAPGGIISVFGVGLARPGTPTAVAINGEPAIILGSTPFQVNAQIPFDIAPGPATLTLTSAYGTVTQPITIQSVAPAIFSVSPTQPAIANQDNTLNGPTNPALRGTAIVIYGTGLGAVSASGSLMRTVIPVGVVVGGVEVPAVFSGLSPGTNGLYQANVILPAALPPGLSLPLYVKQGDSISNKVLVAIQ